MPPVLRFLVPILVALAGVAHLHAQEVDASIAGMVLEQNGTPVPNAQVSVVNLLNGISRQTQTDPDGFFAIQFLQAALYDVRVDAVGLQSGGLNAFQLRPGQVLRLDFTLSRAQAVGLAAPDYTWMQTGSATVTRLVERRNIRDLPLNGRNFIQLAQLLPGVLPGAPGSNTSTWTRAWLGESAPETGIKAIVADGARDNGSRYFLDGVEFMDFRTQAYPFSPSIDAVAEVKVETSTYSALYGTAPGAHVDLVTRTGEGGVHGTLWAFNRNDYFSQTRDEIAGRTLTPPRLNRNQYGVNLGGPLHASGRVLARGKTFFFLNWEGGRLREGRLSEPLRVPSAQARAGNFEGLRNARTGQPIALRDPGSAGIVGNRLPLTSLSAPALTFLAATPAPNTQEGSFNYRSRESLARARQENFLGRLDHNLVSNSVLTARFARSDLHHEGAPVWGSEQRLSRLHAENALLQYTHASRASLVNQFRVGWNRVSDRDWYASSGNAAQDVLGLMNIPGLSRLPQDFGLPTVRIDGPDGVLNLPRQERESGPGFWRNETFQVSSVLAWTAGKHRLRIGGDWFQRDVDVRQAVDPRGNFWFDGAYTGSALADFLLGYVRRAEVAPTATATRLRTHWFSAFVQEEYRANSRATVSVGLRYDQMPAYYARDGRMVNIEQNGYRVTQLVSAEAGGRRTRMLQGNPTNIGPRIGLAIAPFAGNLVVHAGYGMYFTPNPAGTAVRMSQAAREDRAAVALGARGAAPDTFLADPFAAPHTRGSHTLAVSLDPGLRDAYVQHWNLTVQRKFPLNFQVDAGYAGSRGTRLPVTIDDLNRPLELADPLQPGLAPLHLRRPNADFARPVAGEKSIGIQAYHSLQASAYRSAYKGLELVLAYTLSQCISGPGDSSGVWSGEAWAGRPQDIYRQKADHSLCSTDITHRFTGSLIYETSVRAVPAPVKWLLDGWRIALIPTVSSGAPAPVWLHADTTATGLLSRPDRAPVLSGNLAPDARTWAQWFRADVFSAPAPGNFGTAPRNGSVRLPGGRNLDLAFARALNFQDGRSLEWRAEVFNAQNRFNPLPGLLDRNLQSATFGSIGGGVQGVTTRVIQLACKLNF